MGYFFTGLICLSVGGIVGASLMAVCAASGNRGKITRTRLARPCERVQERMGERYELACLNEIRARGKEWGKTDDEIEQELEEL